MQRNTAFHNSVNQFGGFYFGFGNSRALCIDRHIVGTFGKGGREECNAAGRRCKHLHVTTTTAVAAYRVALIEYGNVTLCKFGKGIASGLSIVVGCGITFAFLREFAHFCIPCAVLVLSII